MYRDEICLGNDKNKICVENFLFLSAFELSEDPFKYVDFDGIIGLGFSDLSMSPESNFLTSLLKTGKIRNKIFAFYFKTNFFPLKYDKKSYRKSKLPYKYDKKTKENLSELVIGGIDFNRIKGEIYFIEVISKKYWEVKIDDIFYGSVKLPYCEKVNCTAIIDTGTSTLGVSDNFLNVFGKLTNLNNNCSNLKTLKPLIFVIGGIYFELDPKDYVLKLKIDGNSGVEYLIANDEVEEK
jgi:pepsin A